jgi:phosphatidylcholine synthase
MENTYPATEYPDWSPNKREKLLAWSAHLFTVSGVLWGLLAILAIINQTWIWAFVWIAAAIFVDSTDGLLARRLRVKEALPGFDGALLDNIVDYLNYTFVPAFFIIQTDLMPPQAALIAAVLILFSSAYQFCQADAKTSDNYFKGFPSYWNILVYYLFILNLPTWANFAIVIFLSIMIFVPIKYIYPTRTRYNQRATLTVALIWGFSNLAILATYPSYPVWLIWISLICVFYYTGMSFYATFRTRETSTPSRPDLPAQD